jgi:uncharacterized protein YgiM (DUF1202 family)
MDAGVALEDPTPDLTPDGGAPVLDAEPAAPTMGATMRVTATSLNLRSGVGTSNAILTVLSCGARVTVVGGPTTGWWNIRSGTFTGWASGAYLVAEASFDPSVCGDVPTPAMDAGTTTTTPPGTPPEVSQMFSLARSAVGYSYYWGHGSWGLDGANHGSCSGSCPSCSHTGSYGADCSGFVAKVWQIPSASPVTVDRHPYSTYNFVNDHTHWSRVNRSTLRPGDALQRLQRELGLGLPGQLRLRRPDGEQRVLPRVRDLPYAGDVPRLGGRLRVRRDPGRRLRLRRRQQHLLGAAQPRVQRRLAALLAAHRHQRGRHLRRSLTEAQSPSRRMAT